MSRSFDILYQSVCNTLQTQHKYRQLPQQHDQSKPLLDFSGNDYLGLSRHPDVIAAACDVAQRYGVGSTGSRLLSGNVDFYEAFEAQIAWDKHTENALIFNSGYQANLSVLACLLDSQVLGESAILLFDKLNHASLYQAAFLSGAQLVRYHHVDMNHLELLMRRYREQQPDRKLVVVSETVFGMDGDVAPVAQLIDLCVRFDALLYLDEAHSTGLLGERGYGESTLYDLSAVEHVIMGSFSKALGSSGAYVACSNVVKNYLVNRCVGFIYSTALSPMVVAAAQSAWALLPNLMSQRDQLLVRAARLRGQLQSIGINTGDSTTSIIPLILGDEARVMLLKQCLRAQGFELSAIRPPTVPPKTARLRMSLNVKHSDEDLTGFLTYLANVCGM